MKKNSFNHVMLDIKAMGNSPNSAIVALGMVIFNPKGVIKKEYKANVHLHSSLDEGIGVESSTIEYWLMQSKSDITDTFFNINAIYVEDAVSEIMNFFSENELQKDTVRVWANSPSFDFVVLENSFQKFGYTLPWYFYQQRCVGTVIDVCPVLMSSDRIVDDHCPLKTCKSQVSILCEALKYINPLI